jgi:hypothetical protein
MISLLTAAVGAIMASPFQALLLAVSIITQQKAAASAREAQARAQAASEAAADAAKGQQFVTDGEPTALGICYGRNLIGGTRVYSNTFNAFWNAAMSGSVNFAGTGGIPDSGGDKHEYLITQQALCFGPISAIWDVDIDGKRLNGDTDPVTGAWVNPYAGAVAAYVHPTGGVACPALAALDTGRATSVFTGIANATCVFKLNRDDPQFNGIPNAQFYIHGLKVPTIAGSAGARTISTYTYSNNPALCLLEYLTNTRYGLGLPASKIDLDSFYNAYQVCETVVRAGTGGGRLFQASGVPNIKLYECNVTLDSSKTLRENIEVILGTMNDAEFVWSGGKYKLVVKYPAIGAEVVDAEISDDNLVREGETSINWPSAQVKLNFATVRFLNENKDFKEDTVSWPNKYSGTVYSTYLAQDNGIQLESEIFATGVTSYYSALAKAEYIVRSSRIAITYSFTANKSMFRLEPGDIVNMNSKVLGITNHLLKVKEVKPDKAGGIAIQAIRYSATSLAWNVADTEIVPARLVFNDNTPQATGLVLDTVNNELVWTRADGVVITKYLVKYTTDAIGSISLATVWQDMGESTGTSFVLDEIGLTDYVITVIAKGLNKQAPQADWPLLRVETKNFVPADVTGFTIDGNVLSWTAITNARNLGYRVKFQYGSNTDWASAGAFQTGLVSSSPYTVPVLPGNVTVMIKAVNRFGNESANANYLITALGDVPVANVVESIDFKALTWPGTITSMTNVSGNLQATQSSYYYSPTDVDFYPSDIALFYSNNSDAAEWVSPEWIPSWVATGQQMTIDWVAVGNNLSIEYRQTAPDTFFYPDADPFFLADATPMFSTTVAPWSSWLGSLVAGNQGYQFRLKTDAGVTQGVFSEFTVSIDVPDKVLSLPNVAISSGGTRLTDAIGYFVAILNVQMTLQGGSTAVYLEISDKSSTLGPLVYARNAAGTAVNATIDAYLQGY